MLLIAFNRSFIFNVESIYLTYCIYDETNDTEEICKVNIKEDDIHRLNQLFNFHYCFPSFILEDVIWSDGSYISFVKADGRERKFHYELIYGDGWYYDSNRKGFIYLAGTANEEVRNIFKKYGYDTPGY